MRHLLICIQSIQIRQKNFVRDRLFSIRREAGPNRHLRLRGENNWLKCLGHPGLLEMRSKITIAVTVVYGRFGNKEKSTVLNLGGDGIAEAGEAASISREILRKISRHT